MNKIEQEMGDYFEWCEKVRGMTEVTMRAKRNVLTRFVRVTGVRTVAEITNEAMRQWTLYNVERGATAASVNVYNSVVVGMVKYYRELGANVPVNLALIERMKGVRAERKFYTAEEVSRVVAAALVAGDEVAALQITMMFETGMRIAELTRLRVRDFGGVDGRRVRFIGKGRRLREVYVTARTREWVERYVARYGISKEGYLWCVNEGLGGDVGGNFEGGAGRGLVSLNGEPPTINTVRVRLQKVFAAAGFLGFYPHALRHSFATDLQRRGASVVEIKEMIGHSNIATTERYMHGLEGKMRELFEKYR